MATRTNTPIRQHYVAKFNLEYFTDEVGFINIFDANENRYRKSSARDAAVINNFYTTLDTEGNKSYGIEEYLSKIENSAAPIFRKINNGDYNLSEEDKTYLAIYVSLQLHRTPKYREQTNRLVKEVSKKMLQVMASNTELFEKKMESVLKEKVTPDKIKELQKFVFDDQYDISVPQEYSLNFLIENHLDIAKLIIQFKWTLLIAPQNGLFITSDSPLSMVQTKKHHPMFDGPGFLIDGTETTLPLTPKVCLYFSQKSGQTSSLPISRELVRMINIRTVYNSTRFLFSNNEAVLMNLVNRTKKK